MTAEKVQPLAHIRKRDGRKVAFDIEKITMAIYKAFRATGQEKSVEACKMLANRVAERALTMGEAPTVEEIQDVVEAVLIEHGFVRTAKAYILYRAERTRLREMNTRLMRIYEDITFSSAKDSDIKRENANIDADTAMGTMLKYGSEGAKQFYEMFVLDPAHSQAHKDGDIHIHDMDFLSLTTTCCQIDLHKLFSGGFSTGHGVLREPNDIASYAALACIAIQANQNDQHGGQSVPNFDYALAPGVRKTYRKLFRQNVLKAVELMGGNRDMLEEPLKALIQVCELRMEHSEEFLAGFQELLETTGLSKEDIEKVKQFVDRYTMQETERATFQAMEALVHNLNTMHSRAGAQTPFSSINYGTDTTPEGRMVIRNILKSTDAGLGNGETAIFPIHIFRVKDGINYEPGEPNYDLFQQAMAVSARRLFPNFSFQDAPFNIPYYKPGHPETEISYMGCRTRVIANAYDPSRQITFGRGNLSFTSLNLPRIAIRAKGDISAFFDELDRKITMVIEQLQARFEIIAHKKVRNFPFLMGEGVWLDSEKLGPDDEVGEVLKHGTLSMGFIGLAETLKALVGAHHGEDEKAQNLGLEIVSHMRARMDEETRKTGMNYTLIATPAEGLSGRFVRIDRKLYGEIPGVTDRDYYTNSFHVPVYYDIHAMDKIRLEAPYHALTNAGHITYVELDGDPNQNLPAFEKIIRCMHDSGIGYGSINHPVDRDPVCGFSGIIGDKCPGCGRTEEDDVPFDRIRRITGYLVGTLNRFNNAKRAEVNDRVRHGV